MRAIRRKYLAALLLIAAFAVALTTHLAPGAAHAGGSLADCPFGTNWDWTTQSCQ